MFNRRRLQKLSLTKQTHNDDDYGVAVFGSYCGSGKRISLLLLAEGLSPSTNMIIIIFIILATAGGILLRMQNGNHLNVPGDHTHSLTHTVNVTNQVQDRRQASVLCVWR